MKFFTALLGLFALVSTATAFATCPVCPPCKCFLKENPAPLAHYAQWHCRLKSHLLWDTYTLKGTNWLVGEDEIHRTCKKAGIVTQWEYEAHTNQEDKVEFVATFRLPVAAQEYLSKHLNELLTIDPDADWAVKCAA